MDLHSAWKDIPLEANPAIFDDWSASLGLKKNTWHWEDVYSLDEETLAAFRDVKAVVMNYHPSAEQCSRAYRDKENEKHRSTDASVWHCKQEFYQICGTMALLHVFGNTSAPLEPSSPLAKFYADTKDDDLYARSAKLKQHAEIASTHTALALQGDSAVPSEPVRNHYVALVPINGRILDLNGERPYALDRGATSGGFLKDVVEYVKVDILPSVQNNSLNLLALVG